MKKLIEEYGADYALSVSATTRSPRPGEVDGKDYFFVTKDRFEEMIRADALVEYAQYVENYYGTPKQYVFDQLDAGKNVILEIEIQGALKIRQQFPDTRLLFVTAPDAETLRNRLIGRGTESEEVVSKRLSRAVEESCGMEEYDYLVINDDLEECTKQLHSIIMNERNSQSEANAAYRMSSNLAFVNKMRKELVSFSKGE
jgi:guanylate kinase